MTAFDYGQVQHSASRVAIIGSGPSLAGVRLDFPPGVIRIGVGAAVDHLDLDFWFTLDPSPINRRRMRFQRPGVIYYAAVPEDYGSPDSPVANFRDPPEDDVIFLRRITGSGHGRFKTRTGLSKYLDEIHTGNSAWGALQLAVLMGGKAIAMFGVDGTNEGYAWSEGNPRNLEVMPELFASAVEELDLRGIRVVNGSRMSTVDCFPRLEPLVALDWLAHG